jgi:tRNA pseudouridine38-40 synthase
VPLDKLPQVLNSLLPKDISVTAAEKVPDSFHPIWDAKSKTYLYRIYNHSRRNPLLWRYTAFVPAKLDFAAMQEACKHFVGQHDFAVFCASGGSAKTTVREIYELSVSRRPVSSFAVGCDPTINQNDVIEMAVNGNGFLYNMVRIIAGTLVFVGLGKIRPCEIPEIILSKDRAKAGKTMPAKGLTLLEIFY